MLRTNATRAVHLAGRVVLPGAGAATTVDDVHASQVTDRAMLARPCRARGETATRGEWDGISGRGASRQRLLAHSARLARNKAPTPVVEVSSSGEVGEVFVEDTQGARADRSGCDSAECAQAGGTGGVGSALE